MTTAIRNHLSIATGRLCRMSSHLVTKPILGAVSIPKVDPPCKEIKIPVPWGHIAGKEWGSPGGRRVLGIHGWQDNCGTFDTLAPLLQQDIHFVVIDLPGHGLSSHRPDGVFYHALDYVLDIRRVVKFLQWEDNFSFLSHSMGSGMSMLYAAAFPTEVKKMVSLDILRYPSVPTNRYYDVVASSFDKVLNYEELDKSKHDVSVEDAVDLIVASMDGSVSEAGAHILLKRGSVPSGNGPKVKFTRDLRVKQLLAGASEEVIFEALRRIKSKVLVVIASKGVCKPEVVAKYKAMFEANCKSFKLVNVEGTHHVHLNHPERVAPCINEFLNR